MRFLNGSGKFVFTHRHVASRSDDEVKFVSNSQPEGTILFWLRNPLKHFLVQIQKPTRIAKNNLSLVTEFERLGRSPEQPAVQLFLKTLDLEGNSGLCDMQPF